MTYGVIIMYLVAAVLGLVGVVLLARLRSATISERQVYAYRMIGIMLTSAGIVLAMSATAMWRWSMA
ncbi:hypothetical protein ASG67_12515 [Sphingomonas sp. Leaf339]|uniref:hypothetical protein n=1 Tax=Sphingomonas sp. Leaf339 TaxID=1736343 RepID=UPI0006FAC8AB|nr:hypothetical protein [Sphingomonas sp. Leaf339]KQU48156.1 hypothetical protein ASG67_12515 [Sphingomonas sp. Leaf339]